ncbi:MAG: FecR domain-containing protein [Bacteroidales bacterium]
MNNQTLPYITDLLTDEDFIVLAKLHIQNADDDFSLLTDRWPGREDDIRVAVAFLQGVKIEKSPYPLLIPPSYIQHKREQMLRMARQQRKNRYKTRIRIYSGIAASVIVLLGVSLFYMFENNSPVHGTEPIFAEMTPQGEDIQIIVDQSDAVSVKHQIDQEIIVEKDGSVMIGAEKVVPSKTKSEIITHQILVPFGKRTKIILPDSTSLWINSGSKVAYQSDFALNRKLYVEGEVFLDVKPNKKSPFVVKTKHMEVEVLGTAFNVSDFKQDDFSSVVLVRGSVSVLSQEQKTMLQPKQKFEFEQGNVSVESDVNVYAYTCWIDDVINFKDKSLDYIFHSLASYYNVTIRLNADLKDIQCVGSLDLNSSIEELLETITQIAPVSYSVENNVITIDKIN